MIAWAKVRVTRPDGETVTEIDVEGETLVDVLEAVNAELLDIQRGEDLRRRWPVLSLPGGVSRRVH